MKVAEYDVAFGGEFGRRIEVVAGSSGVWTFRFTCGVRPIAPGGFVALFCEVPKFWTAVNVQTEDPSRDGYVRATASDGVRFELRDIPSFYKKLLWGRISLPDGLQEGQEVCFCVGTAQAPAYAIAHAYREAPVSIRVDYFGDGSDHKLWPPMVISVVPGPAAKLAAVLPSRVTKDEPFRLRIRVEDASSNIGAELDDDIRATITGPSGVSVEQVVRAGTDGTCTLDGLRVAEPGMYRATVACGHLRGVSNAMECVPAETALRVFWGDLHNHTGWSDGVGTFQENLAFARDKAFLDVFGFAEHLTADKNYDTCPVDKRGSDWALMGPETMHLLNEANRPGEFATIAGYEYTPRSDGHGPTGDHCVFSPAQRWTDLPMFVELPDLMAMAREAGCLVIPHVGGRTPKWETYDWQQDVTPVAEIASMHEHSEWFIQGALQRGFKVGVCGMSDGHFGMPGYDCWALHGRTRNLKRRNFSVQSAITAFCTTELTRKAAFRAMRERRIYATTGARILLDFRVSGEPMGGELTTRGRPQIAIRVSGTAPVARVDLIRGDRRVAMWRPDALDWSVEWEDAAPLSGETCYYVRVTQEDFALAWSSPVWVRYKGARGASAEQVRQLPLWNSGPEWPDVDPGTCAPECSEDLFRLLKRRGLDERFGDLQLVGVFEENRGRFSFFRGTDAADGAPVHAHHYFEFEDGRLYIARGHSDYGQYANTTEWDGGNVGK